MWSARTNQSLYLRKSLLLRRCCTYILTDNNDRLLSFPHSVKFLTRSDSVYKICVSFPPCFQNIFSKLCFTSPTLWNKSLFENLIVVPLVNKFLAIQGTRMYITVFKRTGHWTLCVWTSCGILKYIPITQLRIIYADLPFLAANGQFRLRKDTFSFTSNVHSLVFFQLSLR